MIAELCERFRAGEPRALSRAISLAEREDPLFPEVYDALWSRVGRAERLGLTGPAGVGKSTLAAGIVREWRVAGARVGVVAVDPSSPFTGGALLGDRIRLAEHSTDEDVFVRSMATRGSLGGLARRSAEVADLYDAFGFDRVLVETVGVGQAELEVAETCELVCVVLQPATGDSVQWLKAGLLELADVCAVNKADLSGADRLVADLAERASLAADADNAPEVLRTVASNDASDGGGNGVADLCEAIDARRRHLASSGELGRRRRARHRAQVLRLLGEELADRLVREIGDVTSSASPHAVARGLRARLFKGGAEA